MILWLDKGANPVGKICHNSCIPSILLAPASAILYLANHLAISLSSYSYFSLKFLLLFFSSVPFFYFSGVLLVLKSYLFQKQFLYVCVFLLFNLCMFALLLPLFILQKSLYVSETVSASHWIYHALSKLFSKEALWCKNPEIRAIENLTLGHQYQSHTPVRGWVIPASWKYIVQYKNYRY